MFTSILYVLTYYGILTFLFGEESMSLLLPINEWRNSVQGCTVTCLGSQCKTRQECCNNFINLIKRFITHRSWKAHSILRATSEVVGRKESIRAWDSAFIGLQDRDLGVSHAHYILVYLKHKGGNLKPWKRKNKQPKFSFIEINQEL